MSKQVFISYSRKDGQWPANFLKSGLEAEGVSVHFDESDFIPNERVKSLMAKGVDETDLTVCVLTDQYFLNPNSTGFELDRALEKGKCWAVRVELSFAKLKEHLRDDVHGLSANYIPELDPYDLGPVIRDILKKLGHKKTLGPVSAIEPQGRLYQDTFEHVVISGSTEISAVEQASEDAPLVRFKPLNMYIATGDGLFSAGNVQISGSVEVNAEITCGPNSVVDVFAQLSYAEPERKLLLQRFRSGRDHFFGEPLGMFSKALEPLRYDPKERGIFFTSFTLCFEVLKAEGPVSIHVKSAMLNVAASGMACRYSPVFQSQKKLPQAERSGYPPEQADDQRR